MEEYDVVIIGSGPGGYVAAIRCSQLGLKTALVEKYSTLGGTCLNVGCMPSKALLDSSELFHVAAKKFELHGIFIKDLAVDFNKMVKRKSEVIKKINSGVTYLMKKNKITVLNGTASFKSNSIITITSDDRSVDVSGKNIVIATGSKPLGLSSVGIDKKRIITSTEALSLSEIPKHLIVIGGGVIGVELGSVYARLGSKVTVVEYTDSILASMDRSLGKELMKHLRNIGFDFLLGHEVKGAKSIEDKVIVSISDKSSQVREIDGDYCLLATGRRPYIEGLNLDRIGIRVDSKGRVEVNDRLETSVPGIFAIGDVIRGPMLAHKASEEGIFVAEIIGGQKPHLNYNLIPSIVYTWPEVASVGFSEEQLRELKRDFKEGYFPFSASGRAITSDDSGGFVKVLVDRKSDELLGVHIIGPRASDLIGEATLAMEFRAAAEDVARTSHGHPTYYEALKEACMAVNTGAMHF